MLNNESILHGYGIDKNQKGHYEKGEFKQKVNEIKLYNTEGIDFIGKSNIDFNLLKLDLRANP